MKLRDAIQNKDYSKFKKDKSPSFYNYYDTLSQLLYDGYDIDWDHYFAIEKSERLEVYAIREWVCTDTHVGLYLYVVDGEPVCISRQSARKSYPTWSFLSADAKHKVRQLFDDFMPGNTTDDTPMIDEDLMELWLDDAVFKEDISYQQMGLSTIHNTEWLLHSVQTASANEGFDKAKVANAFCDELRARIQEHEEFLTIISKNDDYSYDRCKTKAQPIYDKAVEMLNDLEKYRSE